MALKRKRGKTPMVILQVLVISTPDTTEEGLADKAAATLELVAKELREGYTSGSTRRNEDLRYKYSLSGL